MIILRAIKGFYEVETLYWTDRVPWKTVKTRSSPNSPKIKCNKDRNLFYIWTEHDSTSSAIIDFEYQSVPGTYESSRHSREFQTADTLTRAVSNALRVRFKRKPVPFKDFLLHCCHHSDDRFKVFCLEDQQYVQAENCRMYRKGMNRNNLWFQQMLVFGCIGIISFVTAFADIVSQGHTMLHLEGVFKTSLVARIAIAIVIIVVWQWYCDHNDLLMQVLGND